jgi:diguanylate cyclase (GGDEF)-like protein
MLLGTVMAASMGMLYLAGARRRCLLDWSVAGAAFAVSNACGALGLRLPVDHFLVPGIGNACYIAGHFGILAGLRRQAGLPSRWKWMALLGMLIATAHALPFVHASVTHRLILLTPLIVGCDLAAAWLLWRQPDRAARTVGLPLLVLELLFALQLTARALYLVASEKTTLTFMGSEFLQTSGSLFVLVYLATGTMCCVLIVTHYQAQALHQASITDILTGWLNRRALHDIAAREFARCRRSGAPLHFITFDIDHFKAINDRHGHAAGDAAIRHVTATAAAQLRGYDALFRIGGEEFAVLVGDAAPDAVRAMAERLRAQIAAQALRVQGADIVMTVSVGLAALAPGDAGWEEILQRADAALYHAKQHGRNRVSALASSDHFIHTA